MYFVSYWTNAHRIGFGIDVFQFDTTLTDKKAIHVELLLWKKQFNVTWRWGNYER